MKDGERKALSQVEEVEQVDCCGNENCTEKNCRPVSSLLENQPALKLKNPRINSTAIARFAEKSKAKKKQD
ncbi:MAG: hypothetical protein H6619_05670 [Deltaproteobacteria bacterium]|nr:hypothetical protein [Deltaproteobacteria bacterium]